MITDSSGIELKYPKRTCNKCIRYPCLKNMELCRCDFAKYGCLDYNK